MVSAAPIFSHNPMRQGVVLVRSVRRDFLSVDCIEVVTLTFWRFCVASVLSIITEVVNRCLGIIGNLEM